MSYKALYRKYRPSTFEEVCGQHHIVATLQNAIKNNKLAHAYLFCGPRGTGKTSIAKLLAKTINCTNEEHKPCNKCENCINIQESNHPDVIELDGATNNGVDEIRDLIDTVKYAPMMGKYKVYIIDEVHMITPNAFNALLKTLEEPPEYCIFILCTTEPQKILPTIVSRCQRFDFNKVSVPLIKGRLTYICQEEGINCEDEAIQLIAELAEGGLRDALSILDQCIAYAQNDIKVEDVSAVYGIVSNTEKMNLFSAIKNKDTEQIITMVNEFSNKGIDIARLNLDLINMAKEAVIYAYSKKASLLEKLTEENAKELVNNFTTNELLTYIDYLMDIASKFRDATDSLAYFEVGLLKMLDYKQEQPFVQPQPIVVDNDIKIIEEVDKQPTPTLKKKAVERNNSKVKKLTDDEFLMILRVATKALKDSDKLYWQQTLDNTDEKYESIVTMLEGSSIMADSPNDLIIICGKKLYSQALNEEHNLKLLEELVEENYGVHKNVITVTKEKYDYLIQYFKDHRNDPIIEKQEEKEEKKEPTAKDKMTALFGKNGFSVEEI